MLRLTLSLYLSWSELIVCSALLTVKLNRAASQQEKEELPPIRGNEVPGRAGPARGTANNNSDIYSYINTHI